MKIRAVHLCTVTIISLSSLLGLAAVAQSTSTPHRKEIKSPAEYNAYVGAIQQQDPTAKVGALEGFLSQYPNSVMNEDALELLMGVYQQSGNQPKVLETARRVLSANPCNIRALALVAYTEQAMGTGPNAQQNLTEAGQAGEKGLQCLETATKPDGTSEADWEKLRSLTAGIFNSAAGINAYQNNKDYAKAQQFLRAAVKTDSTNLLDVYDLALAYLASGPNENDEDGLFFIARASNLAQGAAKEQIAKFGRTRYIKYHGSETGWSDLLSLTATLTLPNPSAEVHVASIQCNSLDQVVQIDDAMPRGAGHCAGEADFWFTNTSAQVIDCAIIFHKNGRFDPASVLTFTLSPGEKSGGTGKISTCGADSGQMQYQCFPHAENRAANSCTAQIQWQQ